MKKLFSLVALFMGVLPCFAQNARIDSIREMYNEVTKMIDDEFLTPAISSLSVNRPAIGPQNSDFTFFWNDMSSENWDDPQGTGDVVYKVDRKLYMVRSSVNIAASVLTEIEYLYDDEGELAFCFYKQSSGNIEEKRFYYEDKKLIRYIDRKFEVDPEGAAGKMLEETQVDKGFDKDVLTAANMYIERADKLYSYFLGFFELEGLAQ